jgi:hypothetical chaperone protein
MNTIGIDFGTTNSVFAFAGGAGGAEVVPFRSENEVVSALRTTLSFRRSPQPGAAPLAEAGPWAIRDFLDLPEETRFLQSFKSFAASASFTDTAVFTKRYSFEKLMEAFLVSVRGHGGMERYPERLVIGRPVTFAGQSPDDGLAMRRYEAALKAVGFSDITYVLEPVAAAHFYAQRLTRDAVILVGDFGGGTSDFSVLRFKAGKHLSAEALGHSGIGIAGDTFDYRIIDQVVSPRLGKHAHYTSWGKSLPVPIHYFASFSRWNELCLMRRPDVLKELRELARTAKPKGQLETLIELIEGGVSYDLYRVVAKVKAALSEHESVPFRYRAGGVDIQAVIQRSDFERWIADDLAKIAVAVDGAMAKANVTANEIDRVFLTGGTSFVPAVRKLFEQRFAAEKIDTGEQLLSIAKGLALIGASGRAEDWAMAS